MTATTLFVGKAFTMWQPWASLVMIGAKPLEFRSWNLAERYPRLVDKRVAIHAGARSVRLREVEDLLLRLDDPICSTGLIAAKARALLERIRDDRNSDVVERSAILGTVKLGRPRLSVDAMPAWAKIIGDSDRLEHSKWAWPVSDIRPLAEPIRMRGAQMFFNVSFQEAL